MKKKKVLFFGAGVLGSLYAARLHEAGNHVTLVARGSRYEELKKHGVVLKDFDTGEETRTKLRIIHKMPEDEYFDFCVVLVQKTQLESTLDALKVNLLIPAFIFMNNTAEGPQAMMEALGQERVLMGHANAGGERQGHTVLYMITDKMTLGELDGRKSQRLKEMAETFKGGGFAVELSRNIDSWKKYHLALAVPFSSAMYIKDSCNISLSHSRKDTRKCLQGIREGFAVLARLGYPVEPPKLKGVFAIPDFILTPLFQQVLRSKIADIGMARHLRNAQEEMDQLEQEFHALIKKSGLETPVINELHRRAAAKRTGQTGKEAAGKVQFTTPAG
ncbi:MAG: ketopantoate reductase family protein [Candidatus Syntrophonatronum acetioxidans]|uniref:Ketopantoate reductase family protein n=1 Tax=Candidatus Syntrophonatronum acetioxidans TaxID=1795816 RepID=A0A424YE78_9FIRM|nr:MAG: ketopantoate reductase family protein [Candidatus Syntrophonatronum acetioxidans]